MTAFYPKFYFQDAVGMSTGEGSVHPILQERMIDFAVQNVTTADTVNMIPVPSGTMISNVNYQTIATVTSASSTFVIDSATAGITYVSSAAAVAAGLFGVPGAITASTAQKWYAAKDHIRINTVAVANLTVGQIRVFAMMVYPKPVSYVDADGNTQTYTFVDRAAWVSTAPTIP